MSFIYIVCLLVSIACMVLIDYRYKLILYKDFVKALKIMIPIFIFFIAWDLAGISLDIFKSGYSEYMLNIYLVDEFPIEEIFFLILLTYTPLVIFSYLEKKNV